MNSRRALITPQNSFIENITWQLQGQECPFAIGSARIADYPIVYASEGFNKLTGYCRSECLQQSCTLKFMWSDLTGPDVAQRLQRAFDKHEPVQTEIAVYKKNRTPLWLLFKMTPIQNDSNKTVLFLCTIRDISSQKQPILEEDNLTGLGKFARIVRQAARNKAASKPAYSQTLVGVEKSSPQVAAPIEWEQMPRYIHEAPKAAPHILLHYSPFKAAWDWVILLLTLYTAVIVPYFLAFKYKSLDDVPLIVVNSLVDVVFFVDLVLNFHTTYVGRAGEVVSDPKVIRLTYMRTWCAIDVLSCLPYDLVNALQYSSNAAASALSALKILRLLRLVRVARKVDHYVEYGAALLLLIVSTFVVIGHWFACVWYVIGTSEVAVYRYNWLNTLANATGNGYYTKSGSDALQGGPSMTSSYMTALYFTLSCMTSVGFGNVSAATDMEKLFTCFMMIGGALFYASIFGNVTAIMQQFMTSSSKYRDMMNGVKKFVKLYQVPKELSERISDYVVSLWVVTKGIDQEQILSNCPKDIKADICIHLHQKVLKEHPGFRLASEGCLRAMALHFQMVHSAPGDLLFHQGESVDQLCFVVSGSLEVVQDDEVVAILSSGDAFGDDFWNHTTTAQSAASVRALTYCSIHCIKKERLMEVLEFYQAFSNAFRRNMVLTFPLLNRLIFRKIEDVIRQKELDEKYKNESLVELSHNIFVRKFLSRLARSVNSVQDSDDATTKGSEHHLTSDSNHTSSGSSSAAKARGSTGWSRLKSKKPEEPEPESEERVIHQTDIMDAIIKSQESPQQSRKASLSSRDVNERLSTFKATVQQELSDVRTMLNNIEKTFNAFLSNALSDHVVQNSVSSIMVSVDARSADTSPGKEPAQATLHSGRSRDSDRKPSKWPLPVRKRAPRIHPAPGIVSNFAEVAENDAGNDSICLPALAPETSTAIDEHKRKWKDTDIDLL